MRILWMDMSPMPWKQADGWEYLEQNLIQFVCVSDADSARQLLHDGECFDVIVAGAETEGALEFLSEVKSHSVWEKIPSILVSAIWQKQDFKDHSLSPGAAYNYARLPMPVDGFLDVIRSLKEISREDLTDSALTFDSIPASAPTPTFDDLVLTDTTASREQSEAPESSGSAAPVEDADVQVLRKYLHMREEELSSVLHEKQNLLKMHEKLEANIQVFQKKVRELEHVRADKSKEVERLNKEGSERERDLVEAKDQAEFEKDTLIDRVRYLESELKESKDKYSVLKDRVRRDIRKIQSREKELETRLELIKRDSETLVRERDKQVLDLKRKIDAMEYDLDLIQDRKVQAENNADKYVDKISRVAKTLQVAFGVLEEDKKSDKSDKKNEELEPIIGGALEGADDGTESIQASAEGVATPDDVDTDGVQASDEGVVTEDVGIDVAESADSSATESAGATAVEELLQKKVEELSGEELEEAEASTQVFNVSDVDNVDVSDGENPDDGMGEAMGG